MLLSTPLPEPRRLPLSDLACRGFAAVALAAAFAVAPAQAATYTGTWDPAYGAPFPNLGWRGEATFFIPDACGTSGVLTSFSCAGMQVLNAKVEFYDLADPNPVPAAIDTLLWTAPGAAVNLAVFSGGALTAVNTGFLSPFRSPSSTFDNIDQYQFHLEFLLGGARLTHIWEGLSPASRDTSCGGAFEGKFDSLCGLSSLNGAPVPMTFTPAIPEPGTYALMLAGLGAVGWAARRRTRRGDQPA